MNVIDGVAAALQEQGRDYPAIRLAVGLTGQGGLDCLHLGGEVAAQGGVEAADHGEVNACLPRSLAQVARNE